MDKKTNLNQFRRDPVSGQWSIILDGNYDIATLIAGLKPRLQTQKPGTSSGYEAGFEEKTPPEIFAIREHDSQPNQPGWHVRVVPMNQPFLQIFGDLNNRGVGLYDVLDGIGAHELVVESPEANVHLPDMTQEQVRNVLLAYSTRIRDLKKDLRFRYVMVHKHHGGGDNDLRFHSHAHVLATPITPARVKAELVNAMEHYLYKERCLFCDIVFQEMNDGARIVMQNEKFLALAPFASRAPFSTWIMPKKHETFFERNTELSQLADILQNVLRKIKLLLHDPDYIMVLHTGPNVASGTIRGYWKTLERDYHWYIEITPRFRAFASFDVGSGFQVNAVSPERAAQILRDEKV